jgi:hypothetical protein
MTLLSLRIGSSCMTRRFISQIKHCKDSSNPQDETYICLTDDSSLKTTCKTFVVVREDIIQHFVLQTSSYTDEYDVYHES